MTLTRSELLLRAVAGAGVVLAGPLAGRAAAQGGGDVAVLRFALTLEQLEVAFYEHAAQLSLSPETSALAQEFGEHQRTFVAALTQAVADLGGKPDPTPTATFDSTTEAAFLAQAVALEDLGVAALNGAGPRIESREILAVAGSIVSTEAAHAATWRMAAGESPTAAAFDESFNRARVLRRLGPFLTG